MFLYNRGHYSKIDGVNPNGVVLCTSGLNFSSLNRRADTYDKDMVLLDPQLYLCSLDGKNCGSTYDKIMSYPWLKKGEGNDRTAPVSVKRISAATTTCSVVSPSITLPNSDDEILKCIQVCLDVQKDFGVTHFILPTPIATAREDQFSEQLRWIRLAGSLKEKYDLPFLATIALTDQTLLNCNFDENLMLQTILDNATVMDHVEGYYILIERDSTAIQVTEGNVARALLELSYNLGELQKKIVVINFADVFGLVCLAVGASAFGSGYTTKERRLSFSDFVPKGGGMALPKYYSNTLMCDFYSERDINKILELKLTRYISSDIQTAHSKPLIEAIVRKRAIDNVQTWKESRSNTAAAAKHRVDCLTAQVDEFSKIKDFEDRLIKMFALIQDAEAKMEYLKSRQKDDPLNEDGRHLSVWRKAIEEFSEVNKINL